MSIWVDRTKHLFSKVKVLYQQIVESTGWSKQMMHQVGKHTIALHGN